MRETTSPTAPGHETSGPSDYDLHLFHEGTHAQLADRFGAHLATVDGVRGVRFSVWAPAARAVSVIGDFNNWEVGRTPLARRGDTGVFEGFVPGLDKGARYKYRVEASGSSGWYADKADPFALHAEVPPRRASIVWPIEYEWSDAAWMARRGATSRLEAPISIYEVHLGSWARGPDGRSLSYRELAPRLAEHATKLGFTHVELMPVMEHPFYGSWGYQVTSYFAPTSRQGTPEDLMFLVDTLHQAGVGVIFDWVPSHFPTDEHGLGYFDGTHLYEHADPRRGFHPDWQSFIFDYSRPEVRSFLLSSARFWIERYHADGLRVDAVASMLYLDYSRGPGGWIPNKHGGRENLDAIAFLRAMNEEIYRSFPDVQVIAEESTSWPLVSRPLYVGGLGFGFKWDMGWMHDTLGYLARDPIYRSYAQNQLTFRQLYATSENFVLALSHDEVVHGKGSLVGKMPGDRWQRFANLRLLLASMFGQPGKKLLFMGAELGQETEWNHDGTLPWEALSDPLNAGVFATLQALNALYRAEPALHERDCAEGGFEWVDCSDADKSVVAYLRRATGSPELLLLVLHHTPVVRRDYRVGVPHGGRWAEIFNSDAQDFGGSGVGNLGGVEARPVEHHGRPFSIELSLPPLGALIFKGLDPAAPGPAKSSPVDVLADLGWPVTPAGRPSHASTLMPPAISADAPGVAVPPAPALPAAPGDEGDES
jgi:1,4-alpha-glucan branching enzyme